MCFFDITPFFSGRFLQLSCLEGKWILHIPNRSAVLIHTVTSLKSSKVRFIISQIKERKCNKTVLQRMFCFNDGKKKKTPFIVDAYENARNLCDRYYMNSPDLILEEFNGNSLNSFLSDASSVAIHNSGCKNFIDKPCWRQKSVKGGQSWTLSDSCLKLTLRTRTEYFFEDAPTY